MRYAPLAGDFPGPPAPGCSPPCPGGRLPQRAQGQSQSRGHLQMCSAHRRKHWPAWSQSKLWCYSSGRRRPPQVRWVTSWDPPSRMDSTLFLSPEVAKSWVLMPKASPPSWRSVGSWLLLLQNSGQCQCSPRRVSAKAAVLGSSGFPPLIFIEIQESASR